MEKVFKIETHYGETQLADVLAALSDDIGVELDRLHTNLRDPATDHKKTRRIEIHLHFTPAWGGEHGAMVLPDGLRPNPPLFLTANLKTKFPAPERNLGSAKKGAGKNGPCLLDFRPAIIGHGEE